MRILLRLEFSRAINSIGLHRRVISLDIGEFLLQIMSLFYFMIMRGVNGLVMVGRSIILKVEVWHIKMDMSVPSMLFSRSEKS